MASSPSKRDKKPEGSVLKLFDPWQSPYCTCPIKYSLNPYTGCSHRCLYCYITSYIPRGFEARPKKNYLKRLKVDLEKIDINMPISISNSTDPYQPLEKEIKATRSSLRLIKEKDGRVIIVTKSNLVVRDIDILACMKSAVAITITSLDKEFSRRFEPYAPLPEERIEALKALKNAGIPTAVRIDPLIWGVNTDRNMLRQLLDRISPFCLHVTASTYKPRPDNWKRMKAVLGDRLREDDYPEKAGKVRYLRDDVRLELLSWLREEVKERGMSFSVCREGLRGLSDPVSCDATHLIPS